MSSCIYFRFHPGHERQIVTHQGKACVVCLDCGILACIEAIGGHISPSDSLLIDQNLPIVTKAAVAGAPEKFPAGSCRIILNQLSPGVTI